MRLRKTLVRQNKIKNIWNLELLAWRVAISLLDKYICRTLPGWEMKHWPCHCWWLTPSISRLNKWSWCVIHFPSPQRAACHLTMMILHVLYNQCSDQPTSLQWTKCLYTTPDTLTCCTGILNLHEFTKSPTHIVKILQHCKHEPSPNLV